MKVVTWNIHDNAKLPTLSKISTGRDILCIQEVHGSIIASWQLKQQNKYYVGTHKIGTKDWNVIYWNNNYTDNNTMGLAIVYHPDLIVHNQGVYTFNVTEGSKSEIRGLPWIRVQKKGEAEMIIYSFHSSSSGDNTKHANQLLHLMANLMTQTNEATVGDFNLTKAYMEARIALPLNMEAGDVATRPASGKIIDYCVYKSGLIVTYKETLSAYSSDHCPVVFDVHR